ncbi:hypothetical protein F2Q68_00035896 [Brassica cretica]|uniref:No apical meristem-associated C-terminal domain-containing protein n=1 Tax=Brassica cretica TaxID=69181 RepID=A0A8S9GZM4_BRACR|nr:hypothetical protein F2Q68_00035896 [Brassica cretica]
MAKNDGSSKKMKCGDCSHSASSKANEEDSADDDEGTNHPPGVKAAKARSKKTMVDEKELSEFQTMWSIKKQDLALKESFCVPCERLKEWKNHGLVSSSSSKANEEDSADDDEGTNHPPGVKAAKSCSKKTMVDEKELCEFQIMWSIKKQNLALKERLSKIKLLDNLIAKQGPLADYEEALKKKLINELMSN